MKKATVSASRKRIGRPPVGSINIGVRVPPEELSAIDAWIAKQDDPKPSRPEALRRLAEQTLSATPKKRTERGQYRFVVKESTGSKLFIAAEPAGDTIERLGLLSFDLEPGISMRQAQEIARKINYWVTSISLTSVRSKE
jgi:hypothetical protein